MHAPIVRATVQAAALSGCSNVLAQLIRCWRAGTPYTLNTVDIFQFVLFSILACPPNFVWQSWLEAQFPAYTASLPPYEKEALVDQTIKGHTMEEKSGAGEDATDHKKLNTGAPTEQGKNSSKGQGRKLNVKNTAIKFSLDQTLGAAVNTVLFIAGIALIRGQSAATIQQDLSDKFWEMIFAGQRMWPAVCIANFTLVPLEYRMLVASIAGLFWNVYLSLQAGSG
ncbi:hypothetical protein DOTSEDRAFT_84602 [Dothistroma septosporum NZE10]|uniref:Mpv17/PMP22 family protein n=1 Tax=Dothistroma septosporum (strain NZE10 / CBS 128990) TaxID=675120 RepID=N1Q3D2_DOTSN|nr:hypothetical protein DOTSEDRAFT_84602 [Dothistroma septosporum NZE10]